MSIIAPQEGGFHGGNIGEDPAIRWRQAENQAVQDWIRTHQGSDKWIPTIHNPEGVQDVSPQAEDAWRHNKEALVKGVPTQAPSSIVQGGSQNIFDTTQSRYNPANQAQFINF